MTLHKIKINGVRTAVQDVGEGQPVVFAHGWGLSQTWWWNQVAHLKGRYRIVTYDVRGQGHSGGRKRDFEFQALVDDFAALRHELDLQQAVVVGHSMGGAIVLHHAVQQPTTIQGLVLIDSPQADGGFENLLTMLGLDLLARPFLPALGDKNVLRLIWPLLRDQMWSKGFRKRNGPLMKAGRKEFEANSLNAVLAAFSGLARRDDIEHKLSRIKVPALVMIGQRDEVIPRRAAKDLVAELPQARLQIVPNAGHMAMVEAAPFVNRQLDAFLAEVFGS